MRPSRTSRVAVSATVQVLPAKALAGSNKFCPSLRYRTGCRNGPHARNPGGIQTSTRRDTPSAALFTSKVSK